MNCLLLAGYRQSSSEELLGFKETENGSFELRECIRNLKQMGHKVTVVLAGNMADEQLLRCREIMDCELVFDTHGNEANLMTNTRAGLHAVDNHTFIFPVELKTPPAEIWKTLLAQLQIAGYATASHIFRSEFDHQFPLLLTRKGREVILSDTQISSFLDTKLNYANVNLDVNL